MRFFDAGERYALAEPIPIKIKRTDHTTGKSHDGGESGGFIISLKNVFILYEVQRAEREPIASGKRTPKIYTFVLCFIIITLTIVSVVYKSIPPMSVT